MKFLKSLSKNRFYFYIVLIVSIILLIASFITAISLGALDISISDTYRVVIGKIFNNPKLYSNVKKVNTLVIWNLRMPRVLLGLVAGAGLALCGCVMQATVNNPISEPYILGVSSGATFGATLIIAVGLKMAVSLGAFLGALLATILVLMIANKKGKMTTTRLILSGTVVNALFSAFANFIISIWANSDSIMTIKFWTMGALTNASWDNIWLPVIIVGLAIIFFLTQYRVLNTMMLGDEVATTLGINLSKYRIIYMIIIAVLTGVLVSACGIIGFVGLVIPHISRGIVGTNYKKLMPIVIIFGAIFLIWADVLARIVIENSELPIGIFTAIVGAPFFIYIVAKKGYGSK